MRVIDLSQPLVPGVNLDVHVQDHKPVYLGHECYAWDVSVRSHTGTYFETSLHVFRDGRPTSSVPAADLIMPAARVVLSRAAKGAIIAAELAAAGGHVRPGDALLVVTGAQTGRYFERESVGWMIERGVKLLGADLTRYDTGFEHPTGMFVDLFRAEIPIVAGLVNLGDLRQDRFELVVAPLPIQGIGTVPARVLAIERDGTDNIQAPPPKLRSRGCGKGG